VSLEQFEDCKKQGLFKEGLGTITGRIWRGKNAGKHLTCIDKDNELAIREFSTGFHWEDITIVEGRKEISNKSHTYIAAGRICMTSQATSSGAMFLEITRVVQGVVS
jgi:hypothetical protein